MQVAGTCSRRPAVISASGVSRLPISLWTNCSKSSAETSPSSSVSIHAATSRAIRRWSLLMEVPPSLPLFSPLAPAGSPRLPSPPSVDCSQAASSCGGNDMPD